MEVTRNRTHAIHRMPRPVPLYKLSTKHTINNIPKAVTILKTSSVVPAVREIPVVGKIAPPMPVVGGDDPKDDKLNGGGVKLKQGFTYGPKKEDWNTVSRDSSKEGLGHFLGIDRKNNGLEVITNPNLEDARKIMNDEY